MVLIDTLYKSTQLITVQFDHFTLSVCLFTRGIRSAGLLFSDGLSRGKLVHFSPFQYFPQTSCPLSKWN